MSGGKMAMLNAPNEWLVDLTALWVFEGTLSPGLERDAHQDFTSLEDIDSRAFVLSV